MLVTTAILSVSAVPASSGYHYQQLVRGKHHDFYSEEQDQCGEQVYSHSPPV